MIILTVVFRQAEMGGVVTQCVDNTAFGGHIENARFGSLLIKIDDCARTAANAVVLPKIFVAPPLTGRIQNSRVTDPLIENVNGKMEVFYFVFVFITVTQILDDA